MIRNIVVALALASGSIAASHPAAAVAPAGSAAAPTTGPEAARVRAVPVRVASFNIKNVTLDGSGGAPRPWVKRRKVIIDQVRAEAVDVLAVQEANPGRHLGIDFPDGANQYVDLKRGLNKAGGHYRVVNGHSFNCRNSSTWQRCEYMNRGASRGTRILYNQRKLSVVSKGSLLFARQGARDVDRYLAWAVFRLAETNRRFLFATTHIAPGPNAVRTAQWRQLIRRVNRLKGSMPVIVAGDFNTQKYHPVAEAMLPAMKRAGYGDVVNQRYRENPVKNPRPQARVDGWINSFNHGRRNVGRFGFATQRHKAGNNIDWVFASNDLAVPQWKVVVNYDPRTLKVRGTLPSDHNMVRATVRVR